MELDESKHVVDHGENLSRGVDQSLHFCLGNTRQVAGVLGKVELGAGKKLGINTRRYEVKNPTWKGLTSTSRGSGVV